MKPIQEEEITDLADLFKIFSDSTRLRWQSHLLFTCG